MEAKPRAASHRPPAATPSATAGSLHPAKWGFFSPAMWVCLALIAVNVAVYAPVVHHEFTNYDDPEYVRLNPHLSGGLTWRNISWALTTGYQSYWHPLTWMSHMLDVQLYGLNPGPHHATNLLLHIANTILLLGLLHRMTGALGRSAFVAGLFAVHPLQVESVAWVSERKTLLSTLLWMLTLWAYVDYARRPRFARYLIVLFLFALGLMAKPMLVTLPFVLLLLDYWPLRRVPLGTPPSENQRPVSQLVLEKLPLLALAITSSVVTIVTQQRVGAVAGLDVLPLSSRIANALVAYTAYLGKMLWPARLAVFYPFQTLPAWQVAGAVAVLVVVSALVLRAAARHSYLLVGWLWFLGTLVPVIGLVQAGTQSMADRYAYIPFIGLFIMVAWGVPDLLAARRAIAATKSRSDATTGRGGDWGDAAKNRRGLRRMPLREVALPVAAALVILLCAIRAAGQVRYWQDSSTLWTHALAVTTDNYRAHNNLGNALADQGKVSEAIAQYSEALRILPNFVDAHSNLGIVLADQGRLDEAIAHYREALRGYPGFAEAHLNLGAALASERKIGEAITEYSQALRIRPDYADAHYNLANALASQGKIDEAIAHYREAVSISPGFALAHSNLGMLLARQGKVGQAIPEFSEALRINPNDPTARRALDQLTNRSGGSGR